MTAYSQHQISCFIENSLNLFSWFYCDFLQNIRAATENKLSFENVELFIDLNHELIFYAHFAEKCIDFICFIFCNWVKLFHVNLKSFLSSFDFALLKNTNYHPTKASLSTNSLHSKLRLGINFRGETYEEINLPKCSVRVEN